MQLSPSMNEALNQQVIHEYTNVLIYAQIESFFEDLQLAKLAKYFRERSAEEKTHADKFIQHINARTGGKVVLSEVPSPALSVTDAASVGDAYVQTEEGTTASIESIYELATDEKSFIDLHFILEMLQEQVGEEDEASEFALKAKNVKDLVLWDATF